MDTTAVITSCGRFDLLEKTISSLLNFSDEKFYEIIVIDNSENPKAFDEVQKISEVVETPFHIIINENNLGQIQSIDKAYSHVKTDFIFHCEDDWEFFDSGFMEKSKILLNEVPNIININLRVRFDGVKGSMHPISEPKTTTNGLVYHEYLLNYENFWHGFSWNPGLRRKKDYDLIKPYKQYGGEQFVGIKYKDLGYVAACFENSYCRHIGPNITTPKSNQ